MTSSPNERAPHTDTPEGFTAAYEGAVERSTQTIRVAGAAALTESSMRPENPYYADWFQHVESQLYQGC